MSFSVLYAVALDVLRLVLFSTRLLAAPTDEELAYRVEIAEACVAATTDRTERYLCMKIPRYESQYRLDVARCKITGKAGELSAWQIMPFNPGDRDRLCKSSLEDAKLAIERIRSSRRSCGHLPTADQLAEYTSGRCDNEEGRRLSRQRWPYAQEIQ